MKAWLTDLRKTALLAAIGMVVEIVLWITSPITAQQVARIKSGLSHPGYIVAFFVLAAILVLPVMAIPIGFLISLYRTKTVVQICDRVGTLIWLAAAIATCFLVWSRQPYFGHAGILYLRAPMARVRFTLALIVDFTWVAFLVSIAMHPKNMGNPAAPDDRVLRRLAKTGTITWGVILGGIVWAAAYTVVYYRDAQHQYFQNLEDYVPLSKLMWEKLRQFLQQFLIFVPFFVIHRGLVERRRLTASISAADASGFDTPENSADRM